MLCLKLSGNTVCDDVCEPIGNAKCYAVCEHIGNALCEAVCEPLEMLCVILCVNLL